MRIFLSYSSDERAEALTVQSWLENNGWQNDVFVDADPQHGLTGGEAWRSALRDAAGRCEAVILLLSRAWLRSKPCWSEFQLAEKYGKPCIPVRVDDAVSMEDLPREITNNYQVIDKVAAPPSDFEIRLKRALEAAGAGPENFTVPPGRRPYPGLEALTESDAALLFGRDADVLAALDTLRETRSVGRKRLIVLLGASGAGKSSLMRAGIWPRLNRDDRNFIALPTIRPLHAILSGKEGLWQALETALADQRRARHLPGKTPRTRTAIRLAAESDAGALALLFADMKQAAQKSFVDKDGATPSIVLSIDQGEELFTSEGATEVELFLRLLSPVWEGDPQFMALIAIRSDVYPQLQSDARIDQQRVRPINLGPMLPAGLAQVIEGPARRIDLEVDPALTAALLRDSEGADALPLLAFTLERLFDGRLQHDQLGLGDYIRMGGVKGAIQVAVDKARAGAVAAGVPAADLDSLLRRTFLPHLARVNDAGEFARRLADLSDFDRECLPLVTVLVAERLLIADQKADLKTVEIAHEAILREWPLLRGWLDAERGFLEWRDQIALARRLYERNEGDLLAGRALAVAQGYLETRHDAVRGPDRAFIETSMAADTKRLEAEEAVREASRQAELNTVKAREESALAAAAAEKKLADAARRTTSRMRRLAGAMALLVAIAVTAGYFAFANFRSAEAEAERARGAAEQERLARSAADAAAGRERLARSAADAAAEQERVARSAADAAAEQERVARSAADAATEQEKLARSAANLARLESESRRIALVADAVRAESGDDKALALAWLAVPHDGSMKSWPLTNEAASAIYSRNSQLIGTLNNAVNTVFSPNGDLAVTVFHDGNAELWNVRTREVLRRFKSVKTEFESNEDVNQDDGKSDNIEYRGFGQGSLPLYFLNGGKDVVMVHEDDVVRVWDVASVSQKTRYEFPFQKDYVEQVVFSPDGSYLFVLTKERGGVVWNLSSGRQSLNIRNRKLIGGSFDESGIFFFGHSDLNSGTVWRIEDKRELFSIPEPRGKREGYYNWYYKGQVHFSRETNRLLTTTASRNRDAYLWDLKSGHLIAKLITEDGSTGFGDQFQFTFIGDGKQVLIGAKESRIGWVWDALTGRLIRKIDGYTGVGSNEDQDKVLKLVDGRIVVSGLDGKEKLRFGRGFNTNQAVDLAIDFDASVAMAGGRRHEGPMELWDIKADAVRANLGRISSDGSGTGFGLSSDGSQALTENDDGTARLWNTKTGALLGTLRSENDSLSADGARFSPDGGSILVDFKPDADDGKNKMESLIWTVNGFRNLQLGLSSRNVALSPDGARIALPTENNEAKIWLTKGEVLVAALKGHAGTVADVAFSSDGTLLITGAWDNTAKIWDAATGALKTTLKGHASGVGHVAFSPDGKLALTGSHDSTSRVWDARTGDAKATLEGHRGSVVAVSFSNAGKRVLTASTDETAVIWDAETGSRLATLAGHTGALFSARFSPDGTRVLTSSEDHTAKIWEATTGSTLATLDGHGGAVNDAQWSPDGGTILTVSSDKTGILWNAATFQRRATLKAHLGSLTHGAISLDGKQAATISEDRTLRLWDIETGALLATHTGQDKALLALALSRDGRLAATTSLDGTARVWTLFPGSLRERIAEVGAWVARVRPLTKDECEQHGVAGLAEAQVACQAE